MSYALYIYDNIYRGVCDGVQPALSYYRGAGDTIEERKTVYKSIITHICLSVAGKFPILKFKSKRKH